MPRKTREEAMRTRQKLVDSALDVMSQKPYSSVSMTEIAERIGYSKGAIYWHFLNKNALLVHVIENACLQFEKELAIDPADALSYDTVRAYFKRKMSKPFENERFEKLQNLIVRRQEWPEEVQGKVMDIFKTRIDKETKMIEQILTKMQKEGSIRKELSARNLATLITAMFHGMFVFSMKDVYGAEMDYEKYTDFIFDAFRKEMEPQEAKDEKK
ncbi:TetR/AcrR family transcriptional regulator [Synergistaceae bacterium OttesenSCG-928-D05]|nr:TetR/AcrR family transcriptional regulator [Synergistaceae bacterium OttesenSCG-928-D05]